MEGRLLQLPEEKGRRLSPVQNGHPMQQSSSSDDGCPELLVTHAVMPTLLSVACVCLYRSGARGGNESESGGVEGKRGEG